MPDTFCPTCDTNLRNTRALRKALEDIIEYCGQKSLSHKTGGYTSYFMRIQGIAQSAISATGEMPIDGFRR